MNGIFRVSAANSEVTKLREAFNSGNESVIEDLLNEMTDFHVASHLIKLFFRELPDPLLRYDCYNRFIECEDDIDKIIDVISTLPRENILTLRCLMTFLAKVASHEEENMMGPSNLAIVFGPTILRSIKESNTESIRTEPVIIVCQTMIEYCDKIFSSPALSSALGSSSTQPSDIVSPRAAASNASTAKKFGKSDMFSCGAAAAAVGLSGLRKTNASGARTMPGPKKEPVIPASGAGKGQPGSKQLSRSVSNTGFQRPVPKDDRSIGLSSSGSTSGEVAALKAELAKMRMSVEKLQAQCAEQDEKIRTQEGKIEEQESQISDLENRLEKVSALASEKVNGDEKGEEEVEEEKEKEEGEEDESEKDRIIKEKMEMLEKGIEELKALCESQKKTIAANKKEIDSLNEKVKKMDDEKSLHKRHKSTTKKDDLAEDGDE